MSDGGPRRDASPCGAALPLAFPRLCSCRPRQNRHEPRPLNATQPWLTSRNEGEARAVLAHVERLLAAGLAPGDIGIITPYSAQARRQFGGGGWFKGAGGGSGGPGAVWRGARSVWTSQGVALRGFGVGAAGKPGEVRGSATQTTR